MQIKDMSKFQLQACLIDARQQLEEYALEVKIAENAIKSLREVANDRMTVIIALQKQLYEANEQIELLKQQLKSATSITIAGGNLSLVCYACGETVTGRMSDHTCKGKQ